MQRKTRITLPQACGVISLTAPSKMPGYSWSLPAGGSCPAAKRTVKDHGAAAVCSGCYADNRGNYRWPNVQAAQDRRFQWIRESIKSDGGSVAVQGLEKLIRKATDGQPKPVFRVHDSGDLFSVDYVKIWIRVCRSMPSVKFWIPTRQWIDPNFGHSLRILNSLPNVSVRPSGIRFGDHAPKVNGLAAGTAVLTPEEPASGHWICPATVKGQDKTCEAHGCRRCWDKATRIAYMRH